MTMSKAHIRASAKYNAKSYDGFHVRFPKGKKADIQAHAETMRESLNGFVNRAIAETIERDKAK